MLGQFTASPQSGDARELVKAPDRQLPVLRESADLNCGSIWRALLNPVLQHLWPEHVRTEPPHTFDPNWCVNRASKEQLSLEGAKGVVPATKLVPLRQLLQAHEGGRPSVLWMGLSRHLCPGAKSLQAELACRPEGASLLLPNRPETPPPEGPPAASISRFPRVSCLSKGEWGWSSRRSKEA